MYQLTVSHMISDDNISYTSYGIYVPENGITIKDISVNKNLVSDLVNKINRLNLSTVHIYDVVEDFLLRN